MSSLAQKFTDIVLIGRGSYIDTLLQILSYQNKKSYKHFNSNNYRFINNNTVVVDGEKVSAKKFFIVLTEQQKARRIEVHGEHPLPSNTLDQLLQTPAKSMIVIGSDIRAVRDCLRIASPDSHTTLICEQGSILKNYDMTVQSIVERYMKKQGIVIIRDVHVLSLEAQGNAVHVVCEQDGKPSRVSAEKLYALPEASYSYDFGLQNVQNESTILPGQQIQYVANNVLLAHEDTDIGLSSLYEIAGSLLSGKKSSITYVPRSIYRSDSLNFFSVGVLEQDFTDTHLSYKKVISKVQGPNKSAQWFIKVITSTSGHIIGMHGVLPYDYANIDLLVGLTSRRSHVTYLKSMCLVNDQLASTYIEILELL